MKRIAWLLMFLLFVPSFVVMAEDQPSISEFQLKQVSDNFIITSFSFKSLKGGIGKSVAEMALMITKDDVIIYKESFKDVLDPRFLNGSREEDENGSFMGFIPVSSIPLIDQISVVEIALMIVDDQGRKSNMVFSKTVVFKKGYRM